VTAPSLATLAALPDEAMVPVRWVRELVAGVGVSEGDDSLGLTVEELAQRTGRAPSTVRSWCAAGRLPGARRLRNREWRVPTSALRALLEDEDHPARNGRTDRLPTPAGGLSAWRNER
jgi:excisionase family DNA binding protein